FTNALLQGGGWLLLVAPLGLIAAFACGWLLAAAGARGRQAAVAALLEERSQTLERVSEQRDAARADAQALAERVASLRTALDAERRQSTEKLRLLGEAREQLSVQFRALAGEVLEEKSRSVGDRHREQLGELLEPLQQRLAEF